MSMLRDALRGHKPSMTVLIADDQPEIRRAVRRVFDRDGRIDVIGEAEDGAQAIAMTASDKPDVVLLDLAMPNTDGMQAIPELLRVSPGTKVVVFSSMAPFNGTASTALGKGASLVLSKNTPPRRLTRALVRLTNKS